MMTGKEKIYFLIERIIDVRDITPSMLSLKISPANDLNNKYTGTELEQLLVKLERDEKIIEIIKVPNRIKMIEFVEELDPYEPYESDDGCYHIKLLPAFDEYYRKIQYEPEYQEFTGKRPPVESTSKESADDEIVNMKSIWAIPTFSSEAKAIVDTYSENSYEVVEDLLNEIISLSELSPDGEIYYEPQGRLTPIQRRQLLKKLENQGLFRNKGEDGIFGIATLDNLNLKLIKEIVGRIEQVQSGVLPGESFDEHKIINENLTKIETKNDVQPDANNSPCWQDDFRWEGNKFVFGKYGNTSSFNSENRKSLFNELTKAKGGWVTVRKLREVTKRNDAYVRPTIGQIENSWSKELRKHISIPATNKDDLFPKPEEGAYRIKFIPNPL